MTDFEKTMVNLKMVAVELPKLAEKIPSIKEEFDMRKYGCYEYSDEKNPVCKTYGCLAGNIARLFDVKNPKYYDEFGQFSTENFIDREFPSLDLNNGWNFLFSSAWRHYQTTFKQAIKRVEYFIAKNGELGEWIYQKEDFVC